MIALLNPKLWIALGLAGALAFSHFFMYRKGAASVTTEWNAAKAVANDEARRLEQRRQSMVDEARTAADKREAALRADAGRSRSALGGLRDAIESSKLAAQQSAAAADQRAAALSELLQSCGSAYQELGRAADGHASDVRTLLEAWPK